MHNLQLQGYSPQLTKRISSYLDCINHNDHKSLEKYLLDEIKSILHRNKHKPSDVSKQGREDYLFCIFLLFEVDRYLPHTPGIGLRRNHKYPYNGIFLSFFKDGIFVDDLLLAMICFLEINEPYYYEKEELLAAIKIYEKGQKPKLFNKAPDIKEI